MSKKKLNLVLIYGGKSGEHEISLRSAAAVLANLDTTRFNINLIAIDKEGRYFINNYDELLSYHDSLPVYTEKSIPLDSLVKQGKFCLPADVVFPVVHGPLYEDGCLQGMLELADIAYVGCGVLTSAIGMDKDMARRIACVNGVKSARYYVLPAHATPNDIETFCQQAILEFGWPLFVKPCSLGSSVGINKVSSPETLIAAIAEAKRFDDEVLIEECIYGREIEIAILENPVLGHPPLVSVPGEVKISHQDGYYSYAAKYLQSEQTELSIPAQLDEDLTSQLQQIASQIFINLKCRGMARVDFFVNEITKDIYFNEINTLPGFTSISMYPKMWQESGLSYPELLVSLIDTALAHHYHRQQIVTHYQ
ncbi:MAG: D-alanine--D-alanine ligase family protein [Legionella sp.]